MSSAALVRSQVASFLEARIPSALTFRAKRQPVAIFTGLPELDCLTGGIPRGALSEIVGGPSCGLTSLLHLAFSSAMLQGECCALIDASDAFDPLSGKTQGIELAHLLWVRFDPVSGLATLGKALKVAEMLLQSGGFGIVAMDVTAFPSATVRRIPLASLFRLRRAVEHKSTALILLGQEVSAGSSASLVVRLNKRDTHWSYSNGSHLSFSQSILLDKLEVDFEVLRNPNLPKCSRSMKGQFELQSFAVG